MLQKCNQKEKNKLKQENEKPFIHYYHQLKTLSPSEKIAKPKTQ